MNKILKSKSRFLALALACIMSLLVLGPTLDVQAKDYGKSLELNNELKFNKTVTNKKTALYYEETFFPTIQKGDVDVKVTCKRKSSGNNYVVTYDVTYNFKKNPQIKNKKAKYDDWLWGTLQKEACYTVFDYKTGKCLENTKLAKDLGIKVKTTKDWKYKWYGKQYYTYDKKWMKDMGYKKSDLWIRNPKTITYSFKVTYPKTCKRAVVAIGFQNMMLDYRDYYNDYSNGGKTPTKKFFDGTGKWGSTPYYKQSFQYNGKKKTNKGQFSYMRLK